MFIWLGPGVLKIGCGLKVIYLKPNKNISDKVLEILQKDKKNFDALLSEGKISETSVKVRKKKAKRK